MHKLQGNQGLNEVIARPIISNIGTATYATAKYLNNLLSLLGKSQHTVLNSKEFFEKIKAKRIPMLRVYLPMYHLMKRLKLFYKKYTWKRKLKLQYQN